MEGSSVQLSRILLLVVALLLPALAAQEPTPTMTEVCGQLERQVLHPYKTWTLESYDLIKRGEVAVYRQESGQKCCTESTLIARFSTRNSRFDLKHVPAGDYWFTADVNGHRYITPIRVVTKLEHPRECSDQAFAIMEGEKLDFLTLIHVD